MQDIQIGRVYRHFKGDYYLVEGVAQHSETGEPYVLYRKLYGDGSLDYSITASDGRSVAAFSKELAALSQRLHAVREACR